MSEINQLHALVLAQQRELEACRPLNDWYRDNCAVAKFDEATQIFTISINGVPFARIIKREHDYELTLFGTAGNSQTISGTFVIDRERTKDYFRMFWNSSDYFTLLQWERLATCGFLRCSTGLALRRDLTIYDRNLLSMEAEQIFAELERAAIAWGMKEGTCYGSYWLVALADISEIKSAKY